MKHAIIRMLILFGLVVYWAVSVPDRFFSFRGLLVFGSFTAYCLFFKRANFGKLELVKSSLHSKAKPTPDRGLVFSLPFDSA